MQIVGLTYMINGYIFMNMYGASLFKTHHFLLNLFCIEIF